jgi:hypothetical protein
MNKLVVYASIDPIMEVQGNCDIIQTIFVMLRVTTCQSHLSNMTPIPLILYKNSLLCIQASNKNGYGRGVTWKGLNSKISYSHLSIQGRSKFANCILNILQCVCPFKKLSDLKIFLIIQTSRSTYWAWGFVEDLFPYCSHKKP